MAAFFESDVEQAALGWLEELEWKTAPGADYHPDSGTGLRAQLGEVVLAEPLREALRRFNPRLPEESIEDAFRKITRPEGPTLVLRNRAFHRMLRDGVSIEVRHEDGTIRGAHVRVVDFDMPDRNDFLAVNQLTVMEAKHHRRPDVVLFVNGLPLAVIELKNAAAESATVWAAFQQLQTYKSEIPTLFSFNELLLISDGLEARLGTLTSDTERFMPWKTIDGDDLAPETQPQLEVVLKGVFEKRRFLSLVRDFIVFEETSGGEPAKKVAGYHQFHAVRMAIEETLRAAKLGGIAESPAAGVYSTKRMAGGKPGDRRIGVVWHTQGSGKSLTMAFYAGAVISHPSMANPTIVVLTDRNDLDDQLFGTFAHCRELLRQDPVQAAGREDLREKLRVDSGGVVFTTIQKFFPEEKGDRHPVLSDRRNIVVIADEAHRSQYDFIDGFARHLRDALPRASFVGFTGTPIELTDKNTKAVFGDYISIYDIQQAVADGATVPIYYEGRLAALALDEREKPHIDPEFEEVTEGEEIARKEQLKSRWAQLEALVGAEKRIGLIARDLVDHFEKRLEAIEGKAMVVCMSRRICVELYEAIRKLRPGWHADDDAAGSMKVVMTGSATDPLEWQGHIRNKPRREELAKRFRTPSDPFRLVIVRDMWLTGFDAPSLHTMYVDKPMRGHGLMQAIARVNRVFRDKPGGLVVDYLGLAQELKDALKDYTQSGGKGQTAVNQEEAVAILLEKHEICCDLFHGFDWTPWVSGTPQQRLGLLPLAQEHVLAQSGGKARLLHVVTELSKAFALAVPHPEAIRVRDDVAFFQAIRAVLAKGSAGAQKTEEELEHAIRQLVSRAVATGDVVDIFAAAGLKKPDISILSDEFLAEVRDLPQKNLAVELLQKLLRGEIRSRSKRNVVQARSFAEMLEKAILRYQNRAVETAQVIEELISLAKEMKGAAERGESLGLTDDEIAFYDALETNDSAVKVLGEPTLKAIARELVDVVRKNTTIDWKIRENVRANLRVIVKRTLRKFGYPPDKQEKATKTVLEQAEVLSEAWADA